MSTLPPPSPPNTNDTLGLLVRLLEEMREQRTALTKEHDRAAKERSSERRWKLIFQGIFFVAPAVLGLLYFGWFLASSGVRVGPWNDVVGVIKIDGSIDSTGPSSAGRIVPLLEKAFKDSNVKGIVLHIDSPGGSPTEAYRMASVISELKEKHSKPVIAVIDSVGASAAYLLALRADEIVAAKYSLVGSVGAILSSWDVHRLLQRWDIAQRVYASGPLKAMLSPFSAQSREADRKAQALVDTLGASFVAEVKERRAGVIKENFDVGSGEVWDGEQAKALGLIDRVATLEQVISEKWNGVQVYNYTPSSQRSSIFSSSTAADLRTLMRHFLSEQSVELK